VTDRATEAVYQALHRWLELDGSVCAPSAELAALTDLSERQVHRALAALVEAGQLKPTGRRRGRTAVFQLTPQGEQAEAAAGRPPSGDPLLTPPRVDTPAEPGAAASDAETPCEPTPEEAAELRRLGLEHVYAWLDQHDSRIGPPEQGEGRCGYCGREVRARWTHGKFVLCRACRVRAFTLGEAVGQIAVTGTARGHAGDAARREGDGATSVAPPPVPPRRGIVVVEAPPDLGEELAQRLADDSSNGNGHTADDPWRP